MKEFVLKVVLLNKNASLPFKATPQSAGLDLFSTTDITIPANNKVIIDTGIAIHLPKGFYGRLADRSSLAAKYSLHVLAGVIDSDFRGSIKIVIFNLSDEDYQIKKDQRVAQIIIEKYQNIKKLEVNSNIIDIDLHREDLRSIDSFGSSGE